MPSTIQLKVLYFQSLRRLVGLESEALTIPEGSTLDGLVAELCAIHPELARFSANILIAVNEEHAERSRVLREGETVALMPPFSGG